jgi:pimeloyl-ACP methyl ester carboxylesterase
MLREQPFYIQKSRSETISAVLHRESPRKLVIMSHGFTGNKIETERFFVNTARYFAQRKISVLRFDFIGSGDSSGDFSKMSPSSEIDDLKFLVSWAQKRGYRDIGLLGLSFGGAVTICTAAMLKNIKTIVTWSSVPDFKLWRSKPDPKAFKWGCMIPGKDFYKKRPKVDVPEAYCSLRIPKLQIQGDRDLPGFRERFLEYFPKAPNPKKHIVVKNGDHIFSDIRIRSFVIKKSRDWFVKHL